MTAITEKLDPWGPISTVLYGINDSDFVQDAIGNTGVSIAWHPLTRNEQYSHTTRIRAFRRDIEDAYSGLRDDQKGPFAQIVVKAMLEWHDGTEIRAKLIDLFRDIGWTISDDGVLKTEDALVSEQFFPPSSGYDAYVAIREIFANASARIVVIDGYIGSSLLLTLKSMAASSLCVRLLTVERNLPSDFAVEIEHFQRQFSHINIAVRTTADFHDRFIAIDDTEFYHVGASIKDAGKRAFMISRIEDQPNIDSLKQRINHAWASGRVLYDGEEC